MLKPSAGSDTINDFTDGKIFLGLAADLGFQHLTISQSSRETFIKVPSTD